MNKQRIWTNRITIENLNYLIGKYEARGMYDAAKALRDLFPSFIDEKKIEVAKKIWKMFHEED